MDHALQLAERASTLLEEVSAGLQSRDQQILEAWPLSRYMACLDKYPETAWLGYRSREVRKACKAIRSSAGDAGLDLYHRALLLALVVRATGALPQKGMPEEINRLYEENFGRIIDGVESSMASGAGSYLYAFSGFRKDLAICTLHLIPAGVEKVHASRLPPRILVTAGLRGGLDALHLTLLGQRGFGPYYQMHLHSQDVRATLNFNRRGWVEFYLRVAELLRRNPRMKGVFDTSWFRDPALARISPPLWSLTTIATDHGARLFRVGPSAANGIRNATAMSARRRRMYEKGEYTPMDYLLVWPRKELLGWAESGPERAVDLVEPLSRPMPDGSGGR